MDWTQFKPDQSTGSGPSVGGGDADWSGFVPERRKSRGATDFLRDAGAALLKIGPTAVKGVGDIAQLATAGNVGRGLSGSMQQGMQSIDEVVGSPILRAEKAAVNESINDPNQGVADVIAALYRNPGAAADMGVATIGSMALPVGAVGVAGKLAKVPLAAKTATGITIGTGAVQNAADTFTGTEADTAGKYGAAGISGVASALFGKLLGGGLEGQIARRITGQPAAVSGVRGVLGSMAREGAQEFGEESSNVLAQNVGEGQPLDLNQAAKQGTLGAVLGAALGGIAGVHESTAQQATTLGTPAGVPAGAPTPGRFDSTEVPAGAPAPVRFDPAAAAAALSPATAPAPQLGYDPTVQNPQTPIVVDPQGNARPMSADEFLSAEASQQDAQAIGLTPDVRQAIEQRNASPEPQPVNVPSDLLERLQVAGWKPPQTPEPAAAAQADVPASDGNNPNPDPQDVAAIGADFERLYQQDVKAGIKQRLGLEKPEPPPAEPKPQASAFRSFLRETGIAPELAADVTGERGFRANSLLPKTFRKGGLQLDEIVQRAVERGFLTDNQVESALDNGGTNRLIEMIQAEMRGDQQVSTEMAGDQTEQAFQRRATDDLDAQARAIGLDADGMDDGQIAAALGRIERRRARAAERGQQFDAPRETRAERQAVRDDADLAALDDADIPWNTTESNVSTEQAMRALGFDDQEIADAIAEESRGAPQGGSSDRSPGQDGASGAQRAPAADQGSAPGPTEGQARADEGLTSYTPEELRQRDQRIAEKAREEARQQAEADAKARADAQRGEFTLTGSDRPADANAGQSSIFDQPAPAQPKPEPTATPAQPAPKPADLVDLRKRLSVLRALKECLGA